MTKGAYYNEREQYIKDLEVVLKPVQDFHKINYVHEFYADSEYIQICDVLGGVIFLDITARSLEDIFKDVAKVIYGQTPQSVVTDLLTRRHIAALVQKLA